MTDPVPAETTEIDVRIPWWVLAVAVVAVAARHRRRRR